MARMPLLPQHILQPLFELYPHLSQFIQSIHPNITKEELESPKDPIRYLLLSHLFLSVFKDQEIKSLLLESEYIQAIFFDIELSDRLLPESKEAKAATLLEPLTSQNLQDYILFIHKKHRQEKEEINNDTAILKNLSQNLENCLKDYKNILYDKAHELNLEYDQNDMLRLFTIYEELYKKNYHTKIEGSNNNQTHSLADHLLSANSEFTKICHTALEYLSPLKENFYKLIIIKYLKKLIERYERVHAIRQRSAPKVIMSWIQDALSPVETAPSHDIRSKRP